MGGGGGMAAARERGSNAEETTGLLPPRTAGEMQRCELSGVFGLSIGDPRERRASAPLSMSLEARSFFSASFSISVWDGVFSTTGRPGDWCCELEALQRFSSEPE